ncbi:hypothetical protein C100_18355 [Sphingobium sp. C100]|jgi:uncharacterized membrane-anchored protein|uniref:DUF3422 domain-containing protein n=1 Tax=Sphingobium sp. C100 TaxID=1207055 RepID=UPI0003D5C7F7|nr:DUF3422 domain-containing protein [Sphingobium sp. C100]ETI61058.1 hypothetical protein C100_18355 [Sphingobium sp. C100]
MRFAEHPQRRQVVGEMHLRRFPILPIPARIVQFARLVAPNQRAAEVEMLTRLPGGRKGSGRHREARWSEHVRLSWEGHSEASTVTLTMTIPAGSPPGWDWPQALDWQEALALAAAMPGDVIRATHSLVVADDRDAASPVADAGFSPSHLVTSHMAGPARMWSDFRVDQEGYGRQVIAANGLDPADLARCVQRLQELGNYRNLALLGLPVARAQWIALDQIDAAIAQTGRAVARHLARDDELLASLSDHSAALLAIASATDFRMAATAAYARIVRDRLREIAPRPIAGFQSLDDFNSRRFDPAIRTCAAFNDRLELLSSRTARFTALLRTRIETHIENQNSRLLASMDRSVRLQLQLQHLVEGLSVVAISYYAIGLIAYPAKAIEKLAPRFSATLAIGMAAPILVLIVAYSLGRLRRRLISQDDKSLEHGS